MLYFAAEIELIGINPFVSLPEEVLAALLTQAKKDKGPIPVKGVINEKNFVQNLMKFKGLWRLYINTSMLKNSPKRIGEIISVGIEFDPVKRITEPHPRFLAALSANQNAKVVFDKLTPSLQIEMFRYIGRLKTDESIDRNITKAIAFLLGKGRFIGRELP